MSDPKDDGPDRVPWVGSALLHGAVFALLVWASAVEAPPLQLQSIQVEIVQAPPQADEPLENTVVPEEQLQVETPEPVVPEIPPPIVEEKPKEVETPPPETKPDPPPDPPEDPPEAARDTAPPEAVTGEEIRVRWEGLKRLYPEYYGNIVTQIRNCLRWTGPANLEAQVYFVIEADGTVSENSVERTIGSGNIRFDMRAVGAIADCAGKGRFGPLPEDLSYDRLPVLFTFRPAG